MPIATDQVVTLHYRLRDRHGQLLDDSRRRGQPLRYLHGHDNIVVGLERALAGQEAGARLNVTLMPAEAYGLRDETLVQQLGLDVFGGDKPPEPGQRFRLQGPEGPRTLTVLAVDKDQVTVDVNHPLAGETLSYGVEILAVRDASKAEISRGRPLDT